MNITLSIDDDVVRKVRKIALDKNTTLTAMVRDYLASVANADTVARKETAAKLRETFDLISRPMGPRNWTRDDLYDRFDRKYD